MPWLDPARTNEPAEDRELRSELREMLGVPASSYFEAESTPDMVTLAESLRHEAGRRQRIAKPKSTWLLMAAALPLAAVMVGTMGWGFQQKQRADKLANTLDSREREIQRLAQDSAEKITQERRARQQIIELVNNQKVPKGNRLKLPAELVIPVDDPVRLHPSNTMQVKGQGQ